ncbi:F-box/kelch-repeat protein [Panicum miliaceum]|uniref:F-box/kelch-repeat protein n=1 Tax=Panicum miliaceum TaxID=4540 RepID=A0A3L6RBL5_PANMI|nr:F-box/kelch-repeat protein [Panicum miliaceum]
MDSPRRSAGAVALLPDDAIVEILSRVPARSLRRFKCVSRGFFYAYDGDDEVHCGNRDDGGGEGGRIVHGRFINTLGRSVPLASFSFLGEQPGIEELGLLYSCNGLVLFRHRRAGDTYDSLGFIVCSPATEQWVAVPNSGWNPNLFHPWDDSSCRFTYDFRSCCVLALSVGPVLDVR